MKKLVIIVFLLLLLQLKKANSQEQIIQGKYNDDAETTVIKLEKRDKELLLKDSKDNLVLKSQTDYRNYVQSQVIQYTAPDNNSFNLVSSFRKNIRFGGFWEGYAIINFTPSMYIEPFSFVSLYASHNYSKYVPVKNLKENFKSLAVEGAAVLAIDNSIKFLLSFNPIIQSIVSFAAKNIVIGIINKNKTSFPEYKYYRYSVNIRF